MSVPQPASALASWGELLDEHLIAIARVGADGGLIEGNERAHLLLSGAEAARLKPLIVQLCRQSQQVDGPVQAFRAVGALGALRICVAPRAEPAEFNAVAAPDWQARARSEARWARALMGAIGGGTAASCEGVLQRAFTESGAVQVALFLHEPGSRTLVCRSFAGASVGHARLLLARPCEPTESAIAHAAFEERPVIVADLRATGWPAERTLAPDAGGYALALPVYGAARGALWAVFDAAPPEQVVRVLLSAADALGAVLQREVEQKDVSSAALDDLLSQVPDVIVEAGADGRILHAYGQVHELFDVAADALLGTSLSSAFRTEAADVLAALIEDACAGRAATAELLTTTGRACAAHASLVRNEGGRPQVRLVLQDISSHKRMEALVEQAKDVATRTERLASLGQLTAGVAHEINNPLAFVRSNLNAVKHLVDEIEEGPEPVSDRVRECLGELRDIAAESSTGVERIVAIVQALRGTARARTERLAFDPLLPIRDAVTIFKGAKKATCEVNVVLEPAPMVMGAPGTLAQVVINLLDNALDAMGGSGRIELQAGAVGPLFRLQVRDFGPGIPEEVGRRVFDPFFTTKGPGKGTGLGLYICREIVTAMGGQIWFELAQPGTRFLVTIPSAFDGEPEPG